MRLWNIYIQKACVKELWNHLRLFITNDISLSILTPQTPIFDSINRIENSVYKITNHILLIFKLQVYKSRKRGTLELRKSTNEIKKVKLLEKMAAQNHGWNWNSIILGNVMGNKNYKPKNIKKRKEVEK